MADEELLVALPCRPVATQCSLHKRVRGDEGTVFRHACYPVLGLGLDLADDVRVPAARAELVLARECEGLGLGVVEADGTHEVLLRRRTDALKQLRLARLGRLGGSPRGAARRLRGHLRGVDTRGALSWLLRARNTGSHEHGVAVIHVLLDRLLLVPLKMSQEYRSNAGLVICKERRDE